MQVLGGKLVSFIFFIGLIIPALPFVFSSQQHVKFIGTLSNNEEDNIKKVSHKLMFDITVHGFLLWASMGFLMPVGILAIRMTHREECGTRLQIFYYVHAVSQILSVLLATAGAILSIKNFNNSFNNQHQRLGVALYGIIWLQALTGFIRPSSRESKGKSVWIFAHWLLGTAVCILGIITIYTGLAAYHEKTSRSIKPWTIALTVEITLIVLVYLFQDKYLYIQKQGLNLRHEPAALRATEHGISLRERLREATSWKNMLSVT